VNETNADLADLTAGRRSSKSGLVDIFLAQQARLRRIAAGMGLGASDVEDVLHDVSIKARSLRLCEKTCKDSMIPCWAQYVLAIGCELRYAELVMKFLAKRAGNENSQ